MAIVPGFSCLGKAIRKGRGLHEKMEHLKEALEAVEKHWQRVHEQRGWTAGEPLTAEQLLDMEGKPVLLKSPWWTEWCIVREHGEHEIAGDAISFTRRHYGEVCLGLSDYGKTCTAYAYQTAHIDREKWEPCEYCQRRTSPDEVSMLTTDENGSETGMFVFNGILASNTDGLQMRQIYFCPICGRPLSEESWAELERRVFGG